MLLVLDPVPVFGVRVTRRKHVEVPALRQCEASWDMAAVRRRSPGPVLCLETVRWTVGSASGAHPHLQEPRPDGNYRLACQRLRSCFCWLSPRPSPCHVWLSQTRGRWRRGTRFAAVCGTSVSAGARQRRSRGVAVLCSRRAASCCGELRSQS